MDPKTIKEILDEVSNTESLPMKISKLKDYAERIELEINDMKIFKLALPYSIVNLFEVLSTIKEELGRLRQGPREGVTPFPTVMGGGGLVISESFGLEVPTVFSNVVRGGRKVSESCGSGDMKSKKPKLIT